MGYGGYSYEAHTHITEVQRERAPEQVFKNKEVVAPMSAYRMKVRESRDSADHPESIAIAIGLDLTGSMAHIPKYLAQRSLPGFMQIVMGLGVKHPQVLFSGIGDTLTDGKDALQVGQFESTAELMNKWLTSVAFVCNGGPNVGESYHLFYKMMAEKVSADCFEKRGQKIITFVIADEELMDLCPARDMSTVFGDIPDAHEPVDSIVKAAARTCVQFCVIPDAGRAARCGPSWRKQLGSRVIVANSHEDISDIMGALTAIEVGAVTSLQELHKGLMSLGRSNEATARIIAAVEAYAHSVFRGAPERPAEPVQPEGGTPRQRRARREGSV